MLTGLVGQFVEDFSGLSHYWCAAGYIDDAAQEAIEKRPGPAWFWFNGTPAPISKDDTPETLIARWEKWRLTYHNQTKEEFLDLLFKLYTPES